MRSEATKKPTAAELVREVGYGGLTLEEVARRAGVHKTTVYQRWPTKPELVAAAMLDLGERVVPIPDTGTLTDDLVDFGRSAAGSVATQEGRRMTRSLLDAFIGAIYFRIVFTGEPVDDTYLERLARSLTR